MALFINDTVFSASVDNIEIFKRIGKRQITHVFHDIDGTHSLIRNWQPVMSLLLSYVIENGLEKEYDEDDNILKLAKTVGEKSHEETDRFCIESAGLSALTQMEWAIRRSIEEGTIPLKKINIDHEAMKANSVIIQKIWQGQEIFDEIQEPAELKSFIKEHAPRLYQVYEKILNIACRDKNLQSALKNPEEWRIPGSMDFVEMLYKLGAKNYFITGAVINYDECGLPYGGMYEEVCALGFKLGHGEIIEAIYGSTWYHKIPKSEVMKKLCMEESIDPSKVLVIGDGRSEITAGVQMNSITISILPKDAVRQHELHKDLQTNIIMNDYTSSRLRDLFTIEKQK